MNPGMTIRFAASTTAVSEDTAMSGRIWRILPSSISTSAEAKSPIWRSRLSTMPPLRRMRRLRCRRASSAVCAAAVLESNGTDATAAARTALVFRSERREDLGLLWFGVVVLFLVTPHPPPPPHGGVGRRFPPLLTARREDGRRA